MDEEQVAPQLSPIQLEVPSFKLYKGTQICFRWGFGNELVLFMRPSPRHTIQTSQQKQRAKVSLFYSNTILYN
jgi:hypothetical protein